ncbi:AMP-binding protein [Alicycliphilus sp. T452]
MNHLHTGGTMAAQHRAAFRAFADREALVGGGVRWSYAGLAERCHRMARYFQSLGLGRQDGIAMLAGNTPEAVVVVIAAQLLGLRYTALHPMGALEDQGFVLRDAGIRLLVVDGVRFAARGAELAALGIARTVVSLGPAPFGADAVAASAAFDGSETPIEVQPDDVHKISYTGGTTGRSKGVVHRQRTALTMLLQQLGGWEWPAPTRCLVATPISHAGGSLVLPTLLRGGSLVLADKFSPASFLQTVQDERISVTFLVPTQIYALLDCADRARYDLSSLQLVLYGAAPIAPARLAEALRVFGPVFGQIYGQAEAPMTIAYLRRDEHDPQRPALLQSCGRPLPGNEVRLLDAQLREVPPGGVGELCVRGPLVMDGYLNRPEETAKALAGDWLHTGDMARMDEQGYLYLVDRAKDMIITGGFNVYSTEVEACLALHPAVAQSAVIGIPDAKWGEAVLAVVVPRPGAARPAPQELMAFVQQHKGPVLAPKAVRFADALPLTPLGKVDKKTLRAQFWQGRERLV